MGACVCDFCLMMLLTSVNRAMLIEVEGSLGGGKAVTLCFETGEDCEEFVSALDRAVANAGNAGEGGGNSGGGSRVKARADGAVLSPGIFHRRFAFILGPLLDADSPVVSQLCHLQDGENGRMVAAVVYLTRRSLIAVPQRYSACACEKTLRKHALIHSVTVPPSEIPLHAWHESGALFIEMA